MDKDSFGKAFRGYRTEVRTRWTKDNLYFLFTCRYEQLHLKPNPNTNTRQETNELWNWDVAEAFIGSNFPDIQRPQGIRSLPAHESRADLHTHARPVGNQQRLPKRTPVTPGDQQRNLNTGDDSASGRTFVSAANTILHDAEHPSVLILPVVPTQ
jgi:hypothetical protein